MGAVLLAFILCKMVMFIWHDILSLFCSMLVLSKFFKLFSFVQFTPDLRHSVFVYFAFDAVLIQFIVLVKHRSGYMTKKLDCVSEKLQCHLFKNKTAIAYFFDIYTQLNVCVFMGVFCVCLYETNTESKMCCLGEGGERRRQRHKE